MIKNPIEHLECNNIVSFEIDGNMVRIMEECDRYHTEYFEKEDLLLLAEQLKELANKL